MAGIMGAADPVCNHSIEAPGPPKETNLDQVRLASMVLRVLSRRVSGVRIEGLERPIWTRCA